MSAKPLITFLPPQQAVFWAAMRIFFMLWRRQLGKSFTLGAKAMDRMMSRKGHSVYFVSASILMGQENILKEIAIWNILLDAYRKAAEAKGQQLTSNIDGLAIDDIAEIFEASKLEVKIWWSRTTYSRSRVIAPNPMTARGFSGDVFGDEIGFWPDFEGVWDAVEPIMSRNPEWMMILATTPPSDDTHPTHELLNPGTRTFETNPLGNWFETESGFPVHRVDAFDAEAAGLPLFHPRTSEIVTIEEARALALNKTAFDRNYLLKFLSSGSAAIARHLLTTAQLIGQDSCTGIDITEPVQAA
jgi:hypothetical protein